MSEVTLRSKDPVHIVAKTVIKNHFINVKGEPIRTPYYQSQIQVLYEDDFYGWIVSDVLRELVDEGFLEVIDQNRVQELKELKYVPNIKFYANKSAMSTKDEFEKMKTHAINVAKVVERYSDPENSKMLGKQLESLVRTQLQINQFDIIGIHTNEYNGQKWKKTEHTLDIIAKKKNKDFVIGVEVKNTLDIIEPDEIDIKIEICKHLNIIPVFAVRWIKPYIECIRRQKGFSWIFKTQIYPFGNEKITKELFQKLSVENKKNGKDHPLQFPITVRNDLPEKSVISFQKWVEQNENNPPIIDTAFRCTG